MKEDRSLVELIAHKGPWIKPAQETAGPLQQDPEPQLSADENKSPQFHYVPNNGQE